MGKKLMWFKLWSDELLADRRVLQLSWAAKGVFLVAICVLRTQTDTPGYFIVNSESLDLDGIMGLLKGYRKDGQGQSEGLRKAVETLLEVGLILRSKDGFYYSPRIVEEFEKSKVAEIGGKARVSEIGDRGGDRAGHLEEKRRDKEVRSPNQGTPIDELPEFRGLANPPNGSSKRDGGER